VNGDGLATYSWNVGISGQAFGVANFVVLTVYEILLPTNSTASGG